MHEHKYGKNPDPNVFIFPVYLGACTAVYEERSRSWWDKLLGRWRYDYAFAFCSPEDLQNNFEYEKGIRIAERRLDLMHTRRGVSLCIKGFAGTLTTWQPASLLALHLELINRATIATPQCWDRIFPIDFSAGNSAHELVQEVHQALAECEGL